MMLNLDNQLGTCNVVFCRRTREFAVQLSSAEIKRALLKLLIRFSDHRRKIWSDYLNPQEVLEVRATFVIILQ